MRRRNRMKIACEMQINIFHWDNLSIAAACRPALHPKTGAQRRLTQTHNSLFTNSIQPIPQTHGGGCFALTSGGWINRGNQHQLAIFSRRLILQPVQIDFSLIMAIGL